MIIKSEGRIADRIYAIGAAELPGYLVVGDLPILFDAGITFMGPLYLKALQEHLGDAGLLRLHFLTHSHFDHAGASPYLKRRIPGLQIGASAAAAVTFGKAGAVELIRSLSCPLEEKYAFLSGGEAVEFTGLAVDMILEEGQVFSLGAGLTCRVLATPGHTRDSLSFYLPEMKALVTGEAAGVFDRDFRIHPEFTSSYRDYLNSLEKMADLDIEIIMMSHFFTLIGDDARDYLKKSLTATLLFRERIENLLREKGGNRQAVVETVYQEDFAGTQAILQDARPYLINLEAKVRVIAEDR